MSTLKALTREAKFAVRDRALCLWLVLVLSLSTISVWFGLSEVERQNATIQNLVEADLEDRSSEIEKLSDWGSAAYYSFHLTYEPPSDFTYAAIGMRDAQPWRHRIRMLALEGQIYERDAGNPSLALVGRFDFAFLSAFIAPLVLIMFLYDLRASEKTAGRHDLLEATVGQPFGFWTLRASLRSGALFFSLTTPLIAAGIYAGTTLSTLLLAVLYIFFYITFWTLLCLVFSAWRKSGSVTLISLITIWISTAVLLPAGARLAIDRIVPIPAGADILMLQRETVNDAWDLPREATMEAFFERHPEWSGYEPVESSFEWQWYYAFQQVGDQQTEHLSNAYRQGRLQRDRIASWISMLAPPAFLERTLQSLAKTDLDSTITYEEKVRAFHSRLRAFYYPKFFRNEPFDKTLLTELPKYEPDQF